MKRVKIFLLFAVLALMIAVYSTVNATSTYFPCFLSFEAEGENTAITEGFVEIVDANASGGYAVKSVMGATEHPPEVSKAPMKLSIHVERGGKYYIHIRAKAVNLGSNTCWFSINETPMVYTSFPVGSDYQWSRKGPFFLNQGDNTINFGYRHTNLCLDKIIVTKSTTYTPQGLGEPSLDPFHPDYENEFEGSSFSLPNEHPRLLVRGDDIPGIQAKFQDPYYSAQSASILNFAQQEYDCILPQLTGDASTNHNNAYLRMIEANAFLYLINGTTQNAQKAISGILNYLETLAFSRESTNEITREGGYAIFIASEVYDWCYNVLSLEEKQQIIMLCLTHASNMQTGWPPVAGGKAYINGHESEAQIMKDLFAFSVAVFDEYPDAYHIVSERIFNEFIPTKNYYYTQNEFHNQGMSYGPYRFTFELYMKWILNKLGYGELLSDAQLMTGYGFLYARRPDGNFISDGDMFGKTVLSYSHIAPQSLLLSNLYRDPYFKNEFYKSSQGSSSLYIGTGSYSVSLVNYLLIDDKVIQPKSYEDLPLSRYFGNQSGMMIARTNWQEGIGADTLLVSMKVPEKFFGGHGHFDAGEFEIYYKGPLAIDSGVYRYFASDHDYGYNKQTIAHNTMLIYDPDEVPYYSGYPSMGGQRLSQKISGSYNLSDIMGEATDFGKVLGYGFGEDLSAPSYTYLKGDLTKAYNGKAEKYTRSFMFFNFFDNVYPGALIVFDKVVSADASFKKTWLLHSQEEPEVVGNKTTIRRTQEGYNGRLIHEALLPSIENRNLTIVGGPGQEFLVGGKNYVEQGHLESGNYRIELSPLQPNTTDYFLNVLQVADNTLNPSPLESEILESGDFVGVKIKDRVAFFSRLDERTKDEVHFTVNDSSNLIFAISDLKEGIWSISKNGTPYAEKTVDQESGVLSFTGTGGTYFLTYLGSLYHIDITITGNGTVSDYPIAEVVEGRTKTFLIQANTGSYASEILFNGVPITVLNDNQFTTPEIRNDSVLEVTFSPIVDLPLSVYEISKVFTSYDAQKNKWESAVFGRVVGTEENIEEYGILYSPTDSSPKIGQQGVRIFPAIVPKNNQGIYGIHLIDLNNVLGDQFYLKNYIIEKYPSGIKHIRYSENSLNVNHKDE